MEPTCVGFALQRVLAGANWGDCAIKSVQFVKQKGLPSSVFVPARDRLSSPTIVVPSVCLPTGNPEAT